MASEKVLVLVASETLLSSTSPQCTDFNVFLCGNVSGHAVGAVGAVGVRHFL